MDTKENTHFYTLEIEVDDSPESPREWDNLGIMVCWHRGYNLGDEHKYTTPQNFLSELLYELGFSRDTEAWEDFIYDIENGSGEAGQKALNMINTRAVILPLYVYEHGGITMNTNGFSCMFDSGQVGWIFITYEAIRKEYGWNRITAARRDTIEEYLRGEVSTYDQYLTGDVWGYTIKDEEGEHVDSCWGFYGHDSAKEEGESTMEYHNEKKIEELTTRTKKLDRDTLAGLLHDCDIGVWDDDPTADLITSVVALVMAGDIPESFLDLARIFA